MYTRLRAASVSRSCGRRLRCFLAGRAPCLSRPTHTPCSGRRAGREHPPDARGRTASGSRELLAAQRAAHEARLAEAYEAETSSGDDGAWLKALESSLLVDATKWRGKLRTDVDYDALAREPAPAWVASRDFRGAFDALRDAGVVDGAYDLRRLAHGEVVSPRLGDEGTLFLRCDALHRRAVHGSDVEQTFAPIGAVAEGRGLHIFCAAGRQACAAAAREDP